MLLGRLIDRVHQAIVTFDKFLNRLIPQEFNPFYYLGGITNLFWVLLIPTGVFLWFYYTPSPEDAYASVQFLSNEVPYGAAMRAIHRYAGDAMLIFAVLHLLRNYFTDRYRRFRDVPWFSGAALLLLVMIAGMSGYLLVWDVRSLRIAELTTDALLQFNAFIPGLGTALAGVFLGGDQVNRVTLARFLGLHIAGPALIFFFLWMHYVRLHRPKIWPPAFVTLLAIGGVFVVSGLAPVETLPPATDPVAVAAFTSYPVDLFFLWGYPLMRWISPGAVAAGTLLLLVVIFFAPYYVPQKRYINIATVVDENCTGCRLCEIDCPFDAIAMVDRPDHPRYKLLAIVYDNKCAECGICVGACPFEAIELPLLSDRKVEDEIKGALA